MTDLTQILLLVEGNWTVEHMENLNAWLAAQPGITYHGGSSSPVKDDDD